MHDPRQEFIDEHGHYVLSEGMFIFADGATLEDSPWGRLSPPPTDEWEKSKIVCQYWLLVSQQDEQAFIAFKDYLGGHGRRQDHWAKLHDEESQLAHLRSLQLQAKRSRARYMASKRKVKANIPFWVAEREQSEVDEARKKQEFRERLDSYQL